MKRRERNKGQARAEAVQIRESGRHPFGVLDRYVPLGAGELQLYRAIREAVPILDAAIWKLIRLAGGVAVKCGEPAAQAGLAGAAGGERGALRHPHHGGAAADGPAGHLPRVRRRHPGVRAVPLGHQRRRAGPGVQGT